MKKTLILTSFLLLLVFTTALFFVFLPPKLVEPPFMLDIDFKEDFKAEFEDGLNSKFEHGLNSKFEEDLKAKILTPMPIQEHLLLEDRIEKLLRALNESGEIDPASSIPVLGGNPERIFVVASWRSGSTFLSELVFSALRNESFFIYEPLLDAFHVNHVKNGSGEEKALDILQKVMHCQYDLIDSQRHFQMPALFEHNPGLWQTLWPAKYKRKKLGKLSDERVLDSKRKLVQKYCSMYPHQVMKVVRLPLALLIQLLSAVEGEEEAGRRLYKAKILLLVRDPRATMFSRQNLTWCQNSPDCKSEGKLCQNMEDDLQTALKVHQKYPKKLRVIRFEDLATDPLTNAERILQFLNLPWNPSVEKYLMSHAHAREVNYPSSTVRNSTQVPFRWLHNMSKSSVEKVEVHCMAAMAKWGYFPIASLEGKTPLLDKDWPSRQSSLLWPTLW